VREACGCVHQGSGVGGGGPGEGWEGSEVGRSLGKVGEALLGEEGQGGPGEGRKGSARWRRSLGMVREALE
jgi:hypothetical protein